jgi:hypothetical protein
MGEKLGEKTGENWSNKNSAEQKKKENKENMGIPLFIGIIDSEGQLWESRQRGDWESSCSGG